MDPLHVTSRGSCSGPWAALLELFFYWINVQRLPLSLVCKECRWISLMVAVYMLD